MKQTKLLALSVIMGMGLAFGMYALYMRAVATTAQEFLGQIDIDRVLAVSTAPTLHASSSWRD